MIDLTETQQSLVRNALQILTSTLDLEGRTRYMCHVETAILLTIERHLRAALMLPEPQP